MPYLLALLLAGIIAIGLGLGWGYTAADRAVADARADAIRTEAQADAFATRMFSVIPLFAIIGGTLVLMAWSRRRPDNITKNYYIESPKYPLLSSGGNTPLLDEAQWYHTQLLLRGEDVDGSRFITERVDRD